MNLLRNYPKYKGALLILDIVLFIVCFQLSLSVTSWIYHLNYIDNIRHLWVIFSIYIFLSIIYFQFANFYKIQNIFSPPQHFYLILKSIFFIVIGLILFQFFIKDLLIDSRLFYILLFSSLNIVFISIRIPFVRMIDTQKNLKDNIIILGAGLKGKAMLNIFRNKIKIKNVIGFLDDNLSGEVVDNVPVLGKIEDAEKIAKQFDVNYFLLAIDNITRNRFFEVFQYFRKHELSLSVSSDYLQVLYDKLDIDLYDEYGMVRFGSNSSNKLIFVSKRFFDIVCSIFGIIILSPLLIFIYFYIKLTSKGNPIFKQMRVGKNGKPFPFYKFRSMYENSEQDKNRTINIEKFIKGILPGNGQKKSTKVVNETNITPIGKIIRKFSLDELPQLFNVLKGEMSLVGPRPCMLNEWKVYDEYQKLRLSTIPGCTGVWQVAGRSEVDFDETVLMDIYYNHNFTPFLDLKIILKTIPVMILGKGGA